MLGGDCLPKKAFDTHQYSGAYIGDTYSRIELGKHDPDSTIN